jgi:hypothetical protein
VHKNEKSPAGAGQDQGRFGTTGGPGAELNVAGAGGGVYSGAPATDVNAFAGCPCGSAPRRARPSSVTSESRQRRRPASLKLSSSGSPED